MKAVKVIVEMYVLADNVCDGNEKVVKFIQEHPSYDSMVVGFEVHNDTDEFFEVCEVFKVGEEE